MNRQRFLLLAALVLAGPLGAAPAAMQIAGQSFDAEIRLADGRLQLNGVGVRAVAWIKGYAAGLYLGSRATTPAAVIGMPGAKRLELRMLLDVEAKEFVKAIDKGIQRNTPAEQHAALDERRLRFDGLVQALGGVRKGDVVDLDFLPGRGMVFSLNGKPQGEPIPGDDFYGAVLAIFIGDKPVDGRLKQGLLGGAAR